MLNYKIKEGYLYFTLPKMQPYYLWSHNILIAEIPYSVLWQNEKSTEIILFSWVSTMVNKEYTWNMNFWQEVWCFLSLKWLYI